MFQVVMDFDFCNRRGSNAKHEARFRQRLRLLTTQERNP
jgi:hypothetical protein